MATKIAQNSSCSGHSIESSHPQAMAQTKSSDHKLWGTFCQLRNVLLELTRFCNFCNGHALLISHKSKNWKDSKTSNKACATVQAAEHDAVSENINKKHCSWSPELGFLSSTEPEDWQNPGLQEWKASCSLTARSQLKVFLSATRDYAGGHHQNALACVLTAGVANSLTDLQENL